jgi:hypothetical protein
MEIKRAYFVELKWFQGIIGFNPFSYALCHFMLLHCNNLSPFRGYDFVIYKMLVFMVLKAFWKSQVHISLT